MYVLWAVTFSFLIFPHVKQEGWIQWDEIKRVVVLLLNEIKWGFNTESTCWRILTNVDYYYCIRHRWNGISSVIQAAHILDLYTHTYHCHLGGEFLTGLLLSYLQGGINKKQSLVLWAREYPGTWTNDLHRIWNFRGHRKESRGRKAAIPSWFCYSELFMERYPLESSLKLTKPWLP